MRRMANSASGIAVDDDCKLKFHELKSKRAHRYILFKIEDVNKKVVVEKLGSPTEGFDEFRKCFPKNECRYGVFDFDFVNSENSQKSKIVFVAWAPDISMVRNRMIYASTKERFKGELDGIHIDLQATDESEMSIDVMIDRAK